MKIYTVVVLSVNLFSGGIVESIFLDGKGVVYLIIHWWIREDARDALSSRSNFFHFHALFWAKILPNHRLAHSLSLAPLRGEILDPSVPLVHLAGVMTRTKIFSIPWEFAEIVAK